MKSHSSLWSVVLLVAACACGDSSEEADKDKKSEPDAAASDEEAPDEAEPAAEAAPVELAALSLSEAGIAATIQAPTGATAEDSFGSVEVKVGDGSSFYLEINTGAPDMAALIQEWKDNTAQKLTNTHVETEDVLIVETEMFGTTSFWLDAGVTVGEQALHCRSGRGVPVFDRAQIDSFLVACQSLSAP